MMNLGGENANRRITPLGEGMLLKSGWFQLTGWPAGKEELT